MISFRKKTERGGVADYKSVRIHAYLQQVDSIRFANNPAYAWCRPWFRTLFML